MNKTIVFYYHNFWWYWHGNRISLIIKKIISEFWNEYNVIVLNSWEKQDFLFSNIKNLKIINLPNYEIENFIITDNNTNKKIKLYRQFLFKKIFSIKKIETLVVEHFPFWRNFLDNEIFNLVNLFKKYNDKWKVFSSVRDIFEISSIKMKNLELFDRFLIHSDEKIINYKTIFDEKINNKIIYTWYIINDFDYNKHIKEKNHILISIWWGQDWVNWILDFLQKFSKTSFTWKIYINLWKNYNRKNIKIINETYKWEIEIKKYFKNFIELKKSSKLVVTMWWYNNFIENLFYNKKSIIYPRLTDKEQQNRLSIFSKKVDFIYDWNKLNFKDIENILYYKPKKNISIDSSWAYFTANFFINYRKYQYIKIRLTNLCNAKCDMCWVIKRKLISNKYENIKRSILDFYKLWWRVINFTWWEPTIYKWFYELINYSKKLWLITSVSTNGSTLWRSFYEKLLNNWIFQIDYLDISIDWLSSLHDKIRSFPWLFNIVINNINNLKNLWVNIHINVTIRNDNISEMINIFNFFKKLNINSISFWIITSAPNNNTWNLIPSINNLKKFYLIDKKYIINNKWNIDVSFSPDYDNFSKWIFFSFLKNIQKKNNFEKINWNKCSYINMKKEIRINENWNVSPCCIIDDFDENIWNINKFWLLEILCSEKYENFLQRTFPNISKACLFCKIEI